MLQSPLHRAAKKGSTEIIKLLLKKGADISVGENLMTAIVHEAAQEDRREAAALLLEKGARVSSRNETGQRPLHCASKRESTKIIKLLLEENVSTALKDLEIQFGELIDMEDDSEGGGSFDGWVWH